MPTMEIPELISKRNLRINEVCVVLAIGRSTLYRLFENKKITSIKIAGARRVSVAALNEYLARCEGIKQVAIT